MQITHEEARRLIQFKADNSLNSTNEEKLSSHLKDCRGCRDYLSSIHETESTLRQTMRKQWNVHPLPLQMDVLYARAYSNPGANILLTTRRALVGIAVLMFAFLTWQSMSNKASSVQAPQLGTLPMIPTPSVQTTATNTLQSDCQEVRYIVQQGDTLESIAQHFSASKESILAANNLSGETLIPSKELIVPVCTSTPSGTVHPPTFTITPIYEIISTTPG